MSDESYVPFGDEWRKELSKFKKDHLIDLLKDALEKNVNLSKKADKICDGCGFCEYCCPCIGIK